MGNKYSRVPNDSTEGYTPIGHGVKIYHDGVVEAKGFRDSSVYGLEYEEIPDVGAKFVRKIDSETYVEYVPKTVKLYRTSVHRSFSVENAFAVVKGKVRKFILENMLRFKHSSKRLKNEIRKIVKSKSIWNFTEAHSSEHWSHPYVESTTFGPYNYDVQIEVDADLEFINDVIVVKTGGYLNSLPTEETIVYLSPHETLRYEGDSQYITTGDSVDTEISSTLDADSINTVTYGVRNLGVTNESVAYSPSSRMISIPKGEVLAHGHVYEYHDDVSTSSETHLVELEDSIIANVYEKYSEKIKDDGNWDGIIPSGVWCRIENHSFNSQHIGHAGTLKIVPVEDVECSYSATVSSTASAVNYEDAKNKAEQQAESKFHHGLNAYLVNKGVKNKNSKMRRYELLKTRVAQNVYDGLSERRGEIITKMGSTDLNYYDGSSPSYGGSKKNVAFNYASIASQRMADGRVYGPTAIGVMPEDANVYTTSMREANEASWVYNYETNEWENEALNPQEMTDEQIEEFTGNSY